MRHLLQASKRALKLNKTFHKLFSSEALQQNAKDRHDLAACYRIFTDWQGYHNGECFNHLSVRTKSSNPNYKKDVLLLIADGCHWSEVCVSNLVEVDVETGKELIAGDTMPIITASLIHSAIHNDRPWSKALFHLHPTYSSYIACQENPEYPIVHQDLAVLYNEIAFDKDYQSLYARTEENDEGKRLSRQLGDKTVLFHGSHGVSVLADSISMCLHNTYYLEWGAQLITIGQSTGRPFRSVAEQEILSLKEAVTTYNEHHVFFEACKRYITKRFPDLLQ